MPSFQNFKILGTKISFRTESSPELVEKAQKMLDTRYKKLLADSGGLCSRDELLAFLALGVTDELLKTQQSVQEAEAKLNGMLKRIKEATSG